MDFEIFPKKEILIAIYGNLPLFVKIQQHIPSLLHLFLCTYHQIFRKLFISWVWQSEDGVFYVLHTILFLESFQFI